MRGRRGAAMLEGAIVAGLFLALTVGVLDVGFLLFAHHVLADRVRAGARYAALHGGSDTGVINVVLYNTASPANGARPMLSLTPTMVTVERLDSGTASDRVKVSIVNYNAQTFSPFLRGRVGPRSFSAVALVESMGKIN